MMKRARDENDSSEQPAKVRRISDRLSKLSDELLIRILSFVPVPSLLLCQGYVYAYFRHIAASANILTGSRKN